MRGRTIITILAAAVIIGFAAGIAASVHHIISQRYLYYGMYRLITLTFQKNINTHILCTAIGLMAVCVLVARPLKKGVFDRASVLQWGVTAFILLAVLMVANWLIKGSSSFTPRSIIYYIVIKTGNFMSGIISPEYYMETLADCAVPIIILIGTAIALLFCFWVLRKVNWEVIFAVARSGYVKGTALALVVVIALLNLWVIVERKIHAPKGPNVVLIVIDTLRADHVGSYGYQRDTTPHIDRLREDSILFKNAISAAPWTAPSIGSILTSQYPALLGYEGHETVKIDDRFVLLPEIFKDNLYLSKGIISIAWLSYRSGFKQGFDSYDEDNSGRDEFHISSPSITQKAISFLKKHRDEKFFLFVHYFDPHSSYILHPEYDYYPDYSGSLYSGQPMLKIQKKAPTFSAEDVDYLRALYDSEINFTDEYIGRLFQELKDLDLYDNSLIVVTADHGEEFMERGDYWVGHGHKLYQEQIHVPLLIKLPGEKGPEVVEEYVGLIDLMPTIVGLAGLTMPRNYQYEGKMIALERPEEREERPIISEMVHYITLQSLVWNNWKLIYDPEMNLKSLFNLKNDPAESRDVAEKNEELLQNMTDILQRWSDYVQSGTHPPEKTDLTREQKENLKALGYLQ